MVCYNELLGSFPDVLILRIQGYEVSQKLTKIKLNGKSKQRLGLIQRGSHGFNIGGARHTLDQIIGGVEPTLLPLLVIKIPIIGGAAAHPAPPITPSLV